MRRFRFSIWTVLSLLLLAPVVASAQFGDCADIVKTALDATKQVCSTTSRNQACYGHVMLDAQPQPGMGPLQFSQVGDHVDLAQLDSLRLSPMDVTNGTWGVAMVELQADIPDAQKDANVSLLLFGDVQVTNAVKDLVTMTASVTGSGNVNVRRQADNKAFVMATLHPGDSVTVTGRSDDNMWLYIDLPKQDKKGWVNSRLVHLDNDINNLNVARPDLDGYGPMQAFYLKTGNDTSSCSQASNNDGILIQTPEGVAEVKLWINEVRIRLGSTAFIQASPNKQMVVKTVEGEAHVEAFGVEQAVPAGSSVTVPMNGNLAPSAPPSQAHAYTQSDVSDLPVQNLDREIVVAAPAEPTEVPTATMTDTDVPVVAATDTAAPAVTATDTDVPVVVSTDTDVPPTDTDVPPPPTDTPPTIVPPTDVPPTAVPPTDVPPVATDVPPPTDVPPSDPPTPADPPQ